MMAVAVVLAALISSLPAWMAWASNRQTHRCLHEHIEATAAHHAMVPSPKERAV